LGRNVSSGGAVPQQGLVELFAAFVGKRRQTRLAQGGGFNFGGR
jgi:hypothetical protein